MLPTSAQLFCVNFLHLRLKLITPMPEPSISPLRRYSILVYHYILQLHALFQSRKIIWKPYPFPFNFIFQLHINMQLQEHCLGTCHFLTINVSVILTFRMNDNKYFSEEKPASNFVHLSYKSIFDFETLWVVGNERPRVLFV